MSSVGFGPLARIDGPPPIAPLYGLLPAAEAPAGGVRIVGPDLDDRGVDRWINGVELAEYPPDTPDVFDPCAGSSVAAATTKGFGTALSNSQFGAFTLWLAATCTAARIPDHEAFKAKLLAVFAATESFGIAKEFMLGARMPSNPHLADGNGTFPNGNVATKPVNGLGILEAAIAASGRQGLIHCSPQMATALLGGGFAIDNKTGVIRTINGIVVIPDFGYAAGSTPATRPAPTGTQEWMYATGPIDIRRSETFVIPDNPAEALDRGLGATSGSANAVTYRAERYYLVDWDTVVQSAVLVDRCLTTC